MQHRLYAALGRLTGVIAGLAAACALPVAAQSSPASVLAVSVTGIKQVKGKVQACLWRDRVAFPDCPKSRTARRLTVPVSGAQMRIDFPDVAPGRYAVTVEHDINGDGKAGRNFIGMPTEGVGVSNNPGGMPGWDKALIDVSGPTAITVRMRYLFG